MTAPQDFLALDLNSLTAAELADLATHWLWNEVPCQYCDAWVPSRDEPDVLRTRRYEVCPDCEAKFQENKASLDVTRDTLAGCRNAP